MTEEGEIEVPLWVLGPVIVYLSLLFFAALWAAVERTSSARYAKRHRRHGALLISRNRSPQ